MDELKLEVQETNEILSILEQEDTQDQMLKLDEILEPELTDEELNKIEESNVRMLKSWNIVRCTNPACKKQFDMLKCKYDNGSLVCPHCKQTNI